jgi:hypothetical protein
MQAHCQREFFGAELPEEAEHTKILQPSNIPLKNCPLLVRYR